MIVLLGLVALAALAALSLSGARDGSPVFMTLLALATAAYLGALIYVVRRRPAWPRAGTWLVVAMALGMRLPALYPGTGPGSDIFRYLWDARLQRHGHNPYLVIPSDPAYASIHTADTRRMNNMDVPSPYPPAAQLFFRAVTAIRDSPRAVKAALVASDTLVVLVLGRLLRLAGRNAWLVLVYAWHPLVALEGARNGHIDSLGALLIVCAALGLASARSLAASLAFAAAVAVKPLPAVLAPLFWRRVRSRDVAAGGALLAALYAPYVWDGVIPIGSVSSVIDRFRFNGPLYEWLASFLGPWAVAWIALAAGLAVAGWLRVLRPAAGPEAWAWPMAVALAAAPLVYPWYLVWLVPFLTSRATVPLLAWSVAILGVYVVWSFPPGSRWAVPPWLLAAEYAVVLASAGWLLRRSHAYAAASDVNPLAGV